MKKIKESIDLKLIALGVMVSGFVSNLFVATKAYASDFDFLTDGTGNGAFSGVTETVKETGASAYSLMMVVGAIGLVFSLITLGISFAATKNSTKRSENKSHLPYIALGAVIVFGAISLLGLIQTVAQKI